ncbi:MAG: DNA recombination protein RmuC [Rickettsiaceae bacterium]
MFILIYIALAIACITSFTLFFAIIKTKTELKFVCNQKLELEMQNSKFQEENISYIKQVEKLDAEIEHFKRLQIEFDQLKKQHFESTKSVLFDLGNKLSKELIDIHKRENQESRELSEKKIGSHTEKFNKEFERLLNIIGQINKDVNNSKETVDVIKQSLLSPSGAGAIAEITLENILKTSGLRNNLDYIMQYNFITEEKSKLRPDSLVFLPSGNLMVIDAKSSKFLMGNDHDKSLAKMMNLHLKSLASKDYADNILSNTKDIPQCTSNARYTNIVTLMFLPTEQSIEKIIDIDKDFMHKAWELNIFPVGPSGLMNMLSFAKFQISDYTRAENYQAIIDEVRKLLVSISSITDHAKKLSSNLQNTMAYYDKFAASFNRNFLSKVKNIQKLGIDIGNKQIPTTLERYHIFSAQSELVESNASNNESSAETFNKPKEIINQTQ